jgi:hypothetical protein
MSFNLDLSNAHEALIKQLQDMCELKTKKDVIENALTILGWAAAESTRGYSIASVDDEHKVYREIQMPALSAARMKAQLKKQMPAHA